MPLRGSALDNYIERELVVMLAEGIENSPISPKALHKRLFNKGIIKGRLSTLSSRKKLIAEYRTKQIERAGLSAQAKRALIKGRNKEYYKDRYKSKCEKVDELESELSRNTAFLVDLLMELESKSTVPIEHLLSPHLVKKKMKKKFEK